MKNILLVALLIPSFAFADTSVSNNVPVTANTGVDARNMSTSTNNGSDLSHSVGMAVAPGLTTTLSETCMGSTSFGVGFAGGSVSGGTTHVDEECVRRLNSREIRSLGDAVVAKEILCGNKDVRAAFKMAGRPCLIDGGNATLTPNTQVVINNNSKQRQDELYAAALLRIKQSEQK